MVIETGVLPHVARRMTEDPSIGTRLRSIAVKFDSVKNLKASLSNDMDFHRTLIESSGLQPILAFGDLLEVFFQRFREAIGKVDRSVGVENHLRLVDLLVAGKVDAATAELREHIEDNRTRL